MSSNAYDHDSNDVPMDEPQPEGPWPASGEEEAPRTGGTGGTAEALRAERDDLLDRLQRVSADYLNYQKRVRKDVEQARTFANEELMRALLGVLDDMERALEAARANHPPDDPLLTGMQIVHDNALQTLGGFGLQRITAAGQPFDPDRHAALMQQPTDAVPPNTVVQELQSGYELRGRTLRAAKVIVSKAPESE